MATYRDRNGRVQAIVRVKQNGVIVHQESRTFRTMKLATNWAEELEAKLKVNGVPQRKLTTKTLGQLMLDYLNVLEQHQEMRRTRVAEIEQVATYFMRDKLSELEPVRFSEFAQQRRSEGAGPSTVMHNLATVRSALSAAKPMFGLDVSGDIVGEAISALRRAGVVSKSEKRTQRVSDEVIDKLIAEFERIAPHPSTVIPMPTIVRLAVAFPRRLGELVSMRWVDFNRDASIIKLWDTKHPVAKRDEIVPVPDTAKEIILGLPVIDERILPYKSESVSAAFQRACNRLGIADIRFHDLRHEGITRLFDRNLRIEEVALISGHTSWTTLRRYTHPSVTALAEKLNAGIDKAQKDRAEPARSQPGSGCDPDSQDLGVQGAQTGGGAPQT